MTETSTATRPYRIIEGGKVLATAASERQAKVVCARRIASDVEGRTLMIDGPGVKILARNNGLTVRYTYLMAVVR